jgi:hypothetical protein
MDNRRVAVLATTESQGRCTNWRGYSQALDEYFNEVKYYDLINMNWKGIGESLVEYSPDILFILHPDGLACNIPEVKDKTNCIVLFHYMDYNPDITQIKLHDIPVDLMFLSNKEQIPEYEQEFGIRPHYCPIACYEYEGEFPYNPEYADKIVFVGSVVEGDNKENIHYHRSEFYRALKDVYDDKLVNINEPVYPERNDIYDLLPEIYNSAKYCLSIDGWYPDRTFDGYTSNRIWAIMNFNGLPLVQEWKGMKDFGLVDGETCITFKPWDLHELCSKLRHYDVDVWDRNRIRSNALKTGRKLNTTRERLKVIMGVVNDKFLHTDISVQPKNSINN